MGNTQSSGLSGHGSRRAEAGNVTERNVVSTAVTAGDTATDEETHDIGSRGLWSPSRYSGIYNSIRRRADRPEAADDTHAHEVMLEINTGAHVESNNAELEPNITASEGRPVTLRPSRFHAGLLPDFMNRGFLRSNRESQSSSGAQGSGRLHIHRASSQSGGHSLAQRLSLRRPFRRPPPSTNGPSRRIRGPFPLGHMVDDSPHPDVQELHLRPQSLVMDREAAEEAPVRRTRLGRMRHSLHFPLDLFGNSSSRADSHLPRSPTPHPRQASALDDSASYSSSRLGARQDANDIVHELDAAESESRTPSTTSRITSGMTSIRRFHGLRSRSTRLMRRGEHPPLSQVLQLAAAAIAAQLSGQSAGGSDLSRPLAGETFDGSIQNFVQTLQDAASAQAGENIDLNTSDGDLPPVNFMRVFQFPNDENGTPIAPSTPRDSIRNSTHSTTGGEGDRSVTLVLVGVRSMPNIQDGSAPEGGTIGPSLDTLLSLPFMPPANVLRNGSSGALFRRSDNRARGNRRHSMTNLSFPSQNDGLRQPRTRTASRNSSGDHSLLGTNSPLPSTISETPPGPHPPPSTPADVRSGHATPVRRPSSASTNQAPLLPHPEEDQPESGSPRLTSDSTSALPRQRRRSDSEFARRPELGSGALRRNGVVEPDRPPHGAGRSWLIYVVGTNVSPDHPAFTMPSLFTDNPSYEDMQMLSTLLGPVKPPVATQEDINSAGGTYRIMRQDGSLIATIVGGGVHDAIMINDGERCLVCLSEYEVDEELRQLGSCGHSFHRECIDEWLTTGRNSCPMCRGQGVREQSSGTTSPTASGQ